MAPDFLSSVMANIFKCTFLYPLFPQCCTGWADQGVLLLNACLTVREKNANSHKDRGWEKITDAAVKAVSDECPPGTTPLLEFNPYLDPAPTAIPESASILSC